MCSVFALILLSHNMLFKKKSEVFWDLQISVSLNAEKQFWNAISLYMYMYLASA
jgi:hypothetical protein